MLYRLLRSALFLLPAETAHHVGFAALRWLHLLPGGSWLLRHMGGPLHASLRVEALGREFPSPIGLAAGFDKDAIGFEALLNLGFGSVEVGTVTAEPQPGNPRPRLFRLPQDRALLNRMGFNNRGAHHAAKRLAKRTSQTGVVGANIGKTKTTPEDRAAADYATSAAALARVCDYLVVNVSSPNTPGLRNLQTTSALRPILTAVQDAINQECPQRPPALLVKVAPDLDDDSLVAVAHLALELGLAGIVATNTTIGRDGLRTPHGTVHSLGAGGISGPPVADRSLAVLRLLWRHVGRKLVLVSVGGVENAEQAWERITAGATLVQLYTSFVYEGPGLPNRLAHELAARVKKEGLPSIADAIGRDAEPASEAREPTTVGDRRRVRT